MDFTKYDTVFNWVGGEPQERDVSTKTGKPAGYIKCADD